MTTVASADTVRDLLDRLAPPCDWRFGLPDPCDQAAEWIITILIHSTHRHSMAFCDEHREASAERIAGLPIEIVDVQPLRVQR